MNVLYIAYSCNPYSGSEDKMGWNIPLESSKINEVYVITKEEHRQTITTYLEANPNKNLHYYFVDIPGIYKKLFKGFLYSGRLNIWHRRVYKLAKKLVEENRIDIVHQITPVEFRAIGGYGKIKNCKFVVGPVGGGEYVPDGLKRYARAKYKVEIARKIINCFYKHLYKINGRFKSCDYIMYANKETRDYLGLK